MAEINLDDSAIVNITCSKANTFGPLMLKLTVKDSDPKEYYDLTGWLFSMKVRWTSDDPNVLFEFTGNEITGNSSGQIIITKAYSLMAVVEQGFYQYDLIAFKPDGTRYALIKGYLKVNDAVSE